jgi:hypothetical protein
MRLLMRIAGAVLAVLTAGLAACDGSHTVAPTAPSRVGQAQPSGGYVVGFTLQGVSLFGVVSEPTADGAVPIAGALVYCDACGEFGHTWMTTDANGYYSFSGDLGAGGGVWLSGAPTALSVEKEGYRDPPGLPPPSRGLPSGEGWREVVIAGDTRFDMQLVR